MKKIAIYSVLVSLITFVVACDVNDSDEPNAPVDSNGNIINNVDDGTIEATDSSNFRMLLTDTISKTWNTTLFTLAGSDMFTSCRLDDSFIFFADGTYEYFGGNLCGAEDNKRNKIGNWELDYTARKVYFDRGTSNEYIADVIGLQKDELRVKGTYNYLGSNMEVRGLYSTK